MATLDLKLDVARQQLRTKLELKHLKNKALLATRTAQQDYEKIIGSTLINEDFYALKFTCRPISPVLSANQRSKSPMQQRMVNISKFMYRFWPDHSGTHTKQPHLRPEPTPTIINTTEAFKLRFVVQKINQIKSTNQVKYTHRLHDKERVIEQQHELEHQHDLELAHQEQQLYRP